jgi:hypothetical protein
MTAALAQFSRLSRFNQTERKIHHAAAFRTCVLNRIVADLILHSCRRHPEED